MEGFPEIRMPRFSSAPAPVKDVVHTSKETRRPEPEQSTSDAGLPSQLFFADTGGDFEIFRYGRSQNIPCYKLTYSRALGEREDAKPVRTLSECKQELSMSTLALPIYSKVVQRTLSNTVRDDFDGNVGLVDYDDSLILSVYDPEIFAKNDDKECVKRLSANPHDVESWIAHSRRADAFLSERENLERRQVVLETALKANHGNTELLREYMSVFDQHHEGPESVEMFRRLCLEFPHLRQCYFSFRIHDSRTFNMFAVEEEFEGNFDSFKYVEFLFHAGYTERALRIVEFLCKIHFKGLSSSAWLYNNGLLSYPACPADLVVPPTICSSEASALLEWLNVESYRSFKFPRALDQQQEVMAVDEPEEDPDRIVHFNDVSSFTFRPRLSEIFGLFGFDASVPRPFILIEYVSFDYLRKVQIMMSLPSSIKSMLKGICTDMTRVDPTAATFHLLLLSDQSQVLDCSDGDENIVESLVTYLIHCGRANDALAILRKSTALSDKSKEFYIELLLKNQEYGECEAVARESSPAINAIHKAYTTKGAYFLVREYRSIPSWHHPLIFSLLIHSKEALLLPSARQWLFDNIGGDRFAFDALLQFELQYSSCFALRRHIATGTIDDHKIYALLAVNQLETARRVCAGMETPFQAAQTIALSQNRAECLGHSLQAIGKYPSFKHVYLAAIDRLCHFGETMTALKVLTALEERGLRCRTLIEELLPEIS